MLKSIAHIGITVSDINRSIKFYNKILGLKYIGQLEMVGKETDILFGKQKVHAKVAYLATEDDNGPLIELIEFTNSDIEEISSCLFRTSISEICFKTNDIEKEYERMLKLGVTFISSPQDFDFRKDGFSKSKALYFKDPDDIILELMEY